MAGGDIECEGLSTGGRRLHLCGDGVPGVPGSGLQRRRFGDWGLRRASNSIDRFNVAPQAILAGQNQETENVGKTTTRKNGVLKVALKWFSFPRVSGVFLPLHNNGFSSLSTERTDKAACWIFKTSEGQTVPLGGRWGCYTSAVVYFLSKSNQNQL